MKKERIKERELIDMDNSEVTVTGRQVGGRGHEGDKLCWKKLN